MRVVYDDTPGDDGDPGYSPRALPGMEDCPEPIQGLLWANLGAGKRQRIAPPVPEDDDSGSVLMFPDPIGE